MSITRFNHFHARPDTVDALREQLQSIIPTIRDSEGCESVQLLHGTDDPARFFVIEVWASVEAHKASFQNATPEQVQAVMALVAEPPSGYYFEVIG